MRVVRELTIGLGESVTPDTQFTQSWLLENNGSVVWPEGCYLKLVSEINNDGKMFVPQIAPQDTHILNISLVSPSEVGQFKSQFCLCTPNGSTFGPIIWSVVDVSASGTLALTQQLTQLQTSPSKEPQPSSCINWDEIGMEVSQAAMSANTMALVPHCSNIIGTFPVSNQVSNRNDPSQIIFNNMIYRVYRLHRQHLKIHPIRLMMRRWQSRRSIATTCRLIVHEGGKSNEILFKIMFYLDNNEVFLFVKRSHNE